VKRRLSLSIVLLIAVLGSVSFAVSASPPKSGSPCSKLGKIQIFAGKKFTCIKSGKRVVWNKGILQKIPSPSPSPTSRVDVVNPNPSPAASVSQPSITNSPAIPSSPSSYAESPKYAPVSDCKIPDGRIDKTLNFDHFERNNGFPLQGALLPTTGVVNFLTFFVDFSDAIGSDKDIEYFRSQEEVFKNWFQVASYGKLKAEITSANKWFRASKPSAEYILSSSNYGNHPKFAQEFIDLTKTNFNWRNVDAFIIHFPEKNNLQLQSAQLGRNVLLETHQGALRMNYQYYGPWQYQFAREVKNKYPNYWAAQWLHENLHDLGLTLHAPGNGLNTGVGQSQLSYSLALNAWELFKLGWIVDNQVYCAPLSTLNTSIIKLLPLEINGDGDRIAVIPISQFKALVIESRRPVGLSKDWPITMSGIFVYEIDTTSVTDRSEEFKGSALDNGNNIKYPKWAFYLSPDDRRVDSSLPASKLDPDKFYQEWLMRVGETITTDRVKIKFLISNGYDFVEISKR
jgi:hypothetical protein